jgi:hypothetical protein
MKHRIFRLLVRFNDGTEIFGKVDASVSVINAFKKEIRLVCQDIETIETDYVDLPESDCLKTLNLILDP